MREERKLNPGERREILGPMSRETIELARQVMDAVDERDVSRLIELTDPEVEWHSMFAGLSEGGVYRGHPGIRRYLSDLTDAWEITRTTDADAVGVGAVVLLIGQFKYRGRGSGIEAESPIGLLFKFRDQKVLCFRAVRDPEQVLETLF